MKTDFVIYKGSISFPGNQIMIRDDLNKWTNRLSATGSAISVLGGVYMIGKSIVDSPGEISWIGLATIAIGLLAILVGTRISTDGELDAGQVEKAVISHDFAGYLNVTFHLSDSRKRKAVLDYNDEDKFEKFYLKEFIETLNSKTIRTEIR